MLRAALVRRAARQPAVRLIARLQSSTVADAEEQRRLTLLKTDLVDTVNEAASREVPWFLSQMPAAYFRQMPEATQRRHLRAITALSAEGITSPEVQLTDSASTTFISSVLDSKHVDQQLATVSPGATLSRVLFYNSRDRRLSINVFETASTDEPLFGTLETAEVCRAQLRRALGLDSEWRRGEREELLAMSGD